MANQYRRNVLWMGLLFAGLSSLMLPIAKGSPLQDTYITANGVRLHCVSAGKGELIIFLHGFPEFWYEWKDQLREFGAQSSGGGA